MWCYPSWRAKTFDNKSDPAICLSTKSRVFLITFFSNFSSKSFKFVLTTRLATSYDLIANVSHSAMHFPCTTNFKSQVNLTLQLYSDICLISLHDLAKGTPEINHDSTIFFIGMTWISKVGRIQVKSFFLCSITSQQHEMRNKNLYSFSPL